MSMLEILVPLLAIALVAISAVAAIALRRGRGDNAWAGRLAETQAELSGRLGQMASETAARQEQLRKGLDDRLAEVSRRIGDNLREQSTRSQTALEGLKERLAVIDAAQRNITELSGQMVSLQEILSNKQARGAFGEIQLRDLVAGTLPPSVYGFQRKLSNGRIADCLLTLPNPPGSIAIDAKFPLESYRALREAGDDGAREQAGRKFGNDIRKHVHDIAERYIVPGDTAESAVMFLPSEAVFAELHANFRAVIEESFRHRVWIVSPTTMMATLNTVRAVLKDARMREQAGVIQEEVRKLVADIGRLDDRVGKLQRHFEQTADDIRQIRISTEKVTRHADRIEAVELGDAGSEGPAAELPGTAALPPSAPQIGEGDAE